MEQVNCEMIWRYKKRTFIKLYETDTRGKKISIWLWERARNKSWEVIGHAMQQIEWISSRIQREIRPKRNLAFSTERCKSAENCHRCEHFSKPEFEISSWTRQISCWRNHGGTIGIKNFEKNAVEYRFFEKECLPLEAFPKEDKNIFSRQKRWNLFRE